MRMMMHLWQGYPLYYILITIPSVLSTPTGSDKETAVDTFITSFDYNENFDSEPDFTPSMDVVEESSNVPIRLCDHSERGEYANLNIVYLDPPCEKADDGYCGLRRNQNYTFIAKFLPKLSAKTLSVRVTTADPNYGWETLLWPEFSVCSRFNITCPQNPNNLVEAFLDRQVPKGVPPTRALVRVRLLGMNEEFVKRVYICREFNVQLF